MMRRVNLVLLLSLSVLIVLGQEKSPNMSVHGYIKDMASFNFPDGADTIAVDNLVHNRLNFRWFPTDKFTARLELRTRMFTGDLVRLYPNYSQLVDQNNDFVDGSFVVADKEGLVIHTMIDRAYAEWREEGWSLQLGRQRINWGVNLAWNPNDIFNAYSFFDFDYEERAGSDAIRFQRYIGYAGGYDVAIKLADSVEAITAGFLYKWNKNSYDYQLLAGVMKNNLAIGGGWAGSIGTAGFKGEMTWFEPLDDNQDRTVMVSLASDYLFSNSLYLNGSVLYNSSPLGNGTFALTSSSSLDVRSLSPFEWSMFLQTSYPFHPLLNAGLSTMWFPGEQGVFVNPFLTYSIVSNLDLDVIGQLFLNGNPSSVYILYSRLKWSF
jgi:hypothetical protein